MIFFCLTYLICLLCMPTEIWALRLRFSASRLGFERRSWFWAVRLFFEPSSFDCNQQLKNHYIPFLFFMAHRYQYCIESSLLPVYVPWRYWQSPGLICLQLYSHMKKYQLKKQQWQRWCIKSISFLFLKETLISLL